ncbi:OmpA family protein [Tunicatimonas pelagia]|uniref:OmpA family protein n=1 Tax=Tunicatimonas pelagia TaxID=931531 RepID=UPI002665B57A|nr:OmpA family protein [Tunicatimonas pelagia]WKN46206.1 OmpA family protein [Tunicatimonas pelagia]
MKNLTYKRPYKLTQWVIIIGVLTNMQLLSGCTSMNNTTKGGAIGAGAGGAAGAIIGNASGNTAVGAIIGATVGGAAGAVIGRQMDKQAEELEKDLEGATVERVGEGIKITFDSGLLFDIDSDQLRPNTKEDLSEMAETLEKYNDTNILIEGHTDATGSDDYNQDLSEERASSVASYLQTIGVDSGRLITEGYGEEQPIAENDTEAGRQQNRRVEVAIYANDKMVKAAERGDLEAG